MGLAEARTPEAAGLDAVFGLPTGIGMLLIINAVTAVAYMLAAALLLAGGGGPDALNGLTNGAILAATPFGILMAPMCYGLYRTLRTDYREERRATQEAMAYDRETELRQMKEIMAGSPPAPGYAREADGSE